MTRTSRPSSLTSWNPRPWAAPGCWTAGASCARSWRRACNWQPPDRFKAIRLLGRQPLDALDDPRVMAIYLACAAMEPRGVHPLEDVRPEMSEEDWGRYRERAEERGATEKRLRSADEGLLVLLELVAGEEERLEVVLAARPGSGGGGSVGGAGIRGEPGGGAVAAVSADVQPDAAADPGDAAKRRREAARDGAMSASRRRAAAPPPDVTNEADRPPPTRMSGPSQSRSATAVHRRPTLSRRTSRHRWIGTEGPRGPGDRDERSHRPRRLGCQGRVGGPDGPLPPGHRRLSRPVSEAVSRADRARCPDPRRTNPLARRRHSPARGRWSGRWPSSRCCCRSPPATPPSVAAGSDVGRVFRPTRIGSDRIEWGPAGQLDLRCSDVGQAMRPDRPNAGRRKGGLADPCSGRWRLTRIRKSPIGPPG